MNKVEEQTIYQEYCAGLLFNSPEEVYHYNAELAEQEADLANERAQERYYEDRGSYEAALQRQMEDSRGVIQFDDALAASRRG